MTTIDKFRDAVTSHFSSSRTVFYSVVAGGLLLFLSAWLAVEVMVPAGPTQQFVLTGLIVGLVSIVFLGALLGAWRNEHLSRTDPRLFCPQCDGPLQMYRDVVIATRDCPHCGCRVLANRQNPLFDDEIDRELPSTTPVPSARSRAQPVERWLRLRHIISATVYVAVIIALIRVAFKVTEDQSAEIFLYALLLIPMVLCGLTAVILVPGPQRDWTRMFFAELFIVLSAINMAWQALNHIRKDDWTLGGFWAVLAIIGVSITILIGRRVLIPLQCPQCDRRTLVRGASQPQAPRTFYQFYWCLVCQGRYKWRPSEAWKPASSPEDDGFYWLT